MVRAAATEAVRHCSNMVVEVRTFVKGLRNIIAIPEVFVDVASVIVARFTPR